MIRFLKFAAIVTLFAPLSGLSQARAGQETIVGSWKWTRQIGENYYVFTFKKSGELETVLIEPNGRAKGVGEMLGAEGHYHLRGGRLVAERSGEASEGWPDSDGNSTGRHDCALKIEKDPSIFVLSQCALAGKWIREPY